MTSSTGAPAARDRFPWVAGTLYVLATFAWYCVWRHFLAERSSDEAYFENCLWNALHGNGLRTWIEGAEGRGQLHLALHFSPLLYLFVPVYALAPSMHAIHLLISIGVAGAAAMLYRMARESLAPLPARLLLLAFLLHPTVILQTVMEAHEQAFAFFPLVLLVRGYRRGSVIAALAGGLLFVAAREDNVLLVLALAVLAAAARRDLRLASILGALGVGWLGLYGWLSVQVLGGGQVSHLFAGTYGLWGDSPASAAQAVLGDPLRVVRHLVSPVPLGYLVQLLAPFLVVLPFADPLLLAALPQLFMILLAEHSTRMFQLRLHYSVVPVTILYVASIAGLARMGARTVGPASRRISLATVVAALMFGMSAWSVPLWFVRALGRLHPERARVVAVMAMVPDTASVTAPGHMLNHMARRRVLAKTWSGPLTTTEYVILEDRSRQFYPGASVEVFFSPAAAETLRRAGYAPIHERDGWHVWRRAATGRALPDSVPSQKSVVAPRAPLRPPRKARRRSRIGEYFEEEQRRGAGLQRCPNADELLTRDTSEPSVAAPSSERR